MGPYARRLRAALRSLLGVGRRASKPTVGPGSTLALFPGVTRAGGRLVVGSRSSVSIGPGSYINADIIVGDDCRVVIGPKSRLRYVTLKVARGGAVDLGEGVLLGTYGPVPSPMVVDDARLFVGPHARIQAELLVHFGGQMTIGDFTGIGSGSELRCEERVEIGAYCLFSYDVCIYDTNTHSTDWRERRRIIERMYQTGQGEDARPDTAPVSIGDDVWIGKGATILKGSQIGSRCLIGIRTVVPGAVYPDDSVIVCAAPRVLAR